MPDRSRRVLRRGWLFVGAIALVLLAVAELGARALAPYLPDPPLWADDATHVKVMQMDARAGGCVDVVFAGNSMARDAFVPASFSDADPAHRPSYNASLDAASPPLLHRWLTEEVVPRLHPSTVVLAIASLDVNGNSRAARSVLESYDDAALTRPGLVGRVEAAATRSSAILQHRGELRQPAALWDAIDRARRGEEVSHVSVDGLPGVVGRDGQGLSRRELQYKGSPASKAFLTSQLLNDYRVDESLFDTEVALLRELRARGIDVVLVVLPVTADYQGLHPNGTADFETFLGEVRGVADRSGARLVDLHAELPDTSFADTHHLNQAGAETVSRQLPDLLARNGVEVRRRCG